jgi:yecA family protein
MGPAFNGYTGPMEPSVKAALSEAEIEQLADRLEANTDPEAMTLEGVDGLFCALIASPRTVLPNEYLSTIFGADANAFADIEAANATMSLLMRYWNSIIADLERESIHLPFVFDADAGELPGREWAQGFLAGTRLARDGWKELFDSEREGDLFNDSADGRRGGSALAHGAGDPTARRGRASFDVRGVPAQLPAFCGGSPSRGPGRLRSRGTSSDSFLGGSLCSAGAEGRAQ